jgi:hypothetical protein
MSDLVSQNLNMIFKTPKGETVHALKDVNFTLKKRRTFNSSWSLWMWENNFTKHYCWIFKTNFRSNYLRQ